MDASLRRVSTRAFALAALTLALVGCSSDLRESPAGPIPVTTRTSEPVQATGSAPEDPLADSPDGPSAAPPAVEPSGATGCPANGVAIPAGSTSGTIPDVDGDGAADTQFYSEFPDFLYGIQTASGMTAFLHDDLAGPGKHSGWSGRLESGLVITMLDDSRTATLHAFVNCEFVTTLGWNDEPYRFSLNGFGDDNTGVQCSNGNGGRQLIGLNAIRQDDGSYDIIRTLVTVSLDGRRVVDTYSSTPLRGVPAADARVNAAMDSQCADIPTVATSGR